MMLEEATGKPVTEARVRYHRDGVTVRVPVDEAARAAVREAIVQARQLRSSLDRPPVTDNENLCRSCSLSPVCLPEEARHAAAPGVPNREVKRLFPAQDERAILHVVSQGARVGRSGNQLVVRPREEEREGEGAQATHHPSGEIGAVVLHGFAQISTQAIRLCADQNIAVHWLTTGGRHIASLTSSVGQVQRRIRQYQALFGPDGEATRLRLAKRLVLARIDGQRRYLLRATRSDEQRRDKIKTALRDLEYAMNRVERVADVNTLRGHEGDAARAYWSCFNVLLSDDVPESLHYVMRTRRPAVDRISAILNFGYALLQTAVMRAVLTVGLEPALGFYHTPRGQAHPLVLDLMEPFRVPLWDMVVIGSLNRGQWDPAGDFQVTKAGIWLGEEGRKKAIGLFEQRLGEMWKHPAVGYSLSYTRTLELETRLLEKEWSGEPGLFARLRLR